VALAITLLSDLPAANETGVIGRDFAGAEGRAGTGLRLEAVGAILLIAAGALGLTLAPRPAPRRAAAG
jgi:hypothetical protein